jgi:hypothetical protein
MLCRVPLVTTDVSKERVVSIIRVTKIDDIGKMLAVTSNRIRRLLQEPHGVTSQKMSFFKVTTVNTSNITTLAILLVTASVVPS